MVEGGSEGLTLEDIWVDDRLGRQSEADTIQKYLVRETAEFFRLRRARSIVLGVDAPYGHGKSWFLDRLVCQLSLQHPVAKIDAWADDAGDEPLTAFMSAIDEALSPYVSRSDKLKDKLAKAKAAALPVMGKIASGALVKALTKVAGDEAEEQLGSTFEEAVRNLKKSGNDDKDGGAAVTAVEAAFEGLGKEIESLVDRRGAAMLEAYRQRKASRTLFRENMTALVAEIAKGRADRKTPLVVMVDELDRCRPDYAIRVLEDMKHFFEIPGVVFVIGLHSGQLTKSIKAIYGSEFDSEDYLRRFFTRKYELRKLNVKELVSTLLAESDVDLGLVYMPSTITFFGDVPPVDRYIGTILDSFAVTPREAFPIVDGFRLFLQTWDKESKVEPMKLLAMLTNLVRGQGLSAKLPSVGNLPALQGRNVSHYQNEMARFNPSDAATAIATISSLSSTDLHTRQNFSPSESYAVEYFFDEMQLRRMADRALPPNWSDTCEFEERLMVIARFVEEPETAEKPE